MKKKPFLGIGWLPISIGLIVTLVILGPLLTQPPGAQKPDFHLQSKNGDISLQDFQGEVVVLMFGFTHCPEVCPSGLATMAAAINRLELPQQNQVQPVFVSVDPKRDTVDKIAEYTAFFHPKMMGLTGSAEQIDAAISSYGGLYRMVEIEDSAVDYSVDHTSTIYVMDKTGSVVARKAFDVTPAELAETLTGVLNTES